MSTDKSKNTLEELKKIAGIIDKTHEEKFNIYCTPVPEKVVTRMVNFMINITCEIETCKLLKNLKCHEFDYAKKSRFVTDLNEEIFNKIENEVEFLRNNYYYNIVEEFIEFVKRIQKSYEFDEECIIEINKLLYFLKIKSYIYGHEEFDTVKELMDNCMEISKVRINEHFYLYNLLGCKELLYEHKIRLNDISNVKDINLKRALYYYLFEYYSMEFVDRIDIY